MTIKRANGGQNGPGRPSGSGAASGGGLGAKPQDPHASMKNLGGMGMPMPGVAGVGIAPTVLQSVNPTTGRPTNAPGTGFGNTPTSKNSPGVNSMKTTSTAKSAKAVRKTSIPTKVAYMGNNTGTLKSPLKLTFENLMDKTALLGTGLAALLGSASAGTGNRREGMHRGIGRYKGMAARGGIRSLQGAGIGGALGALAMGAIGGGDKTRLDGAYGLGNLDVPALAGAAGGAGLGALGGLGAGAVEGYERAGDYMGAPSYAKDDEKAEYNKRYKKPAKKSDSSSAEQEKTSSLPASLALSAVDAGIGGRSLNKARALSEGATEEEEGNASLGGIGQGIGDTLAGTLGAGVGGGLGGLGGAGLGALLGELTGSQGNQEAIAGGVLGAGLGGAAGMQYGGGKAFDYLKPKHKETDMAKAKEEQGNVYLD
jgi:hypothetical protein